MHQYRVTFALKICSPKSSLPQVSTRAESLCAPLTSARRQSTRVHENLSQANASPSIPHMYIRVILQFVLFVIRQVFCWQPISSNWLHISQHFSPCKRRGMGWILEAIKYDVVCSKDCSHLLIDGFLIRMHKIA